MRTNRFHHASIQRFDCFIVCLFLLERITGLNFMKILLIYICNQALVGEVLLHDCKISTLIGWLMDAAGISLWCCCTFFSMLSISVKGCAHALYYIIYCISIRCHITLKWTWLSVFSNYFCIFTFVAEIFTNSQWIIYLESFFHPDWILLC